MRNTVVVGLGLTGISCVRYLTQHTQDRVVVVDSREKPPLLADFKASYPQISVEVGLDSSVLATADRIIISPGVSVKSNFLRSSVQKGIPILNDIGLFLEADLGPFIAITGSNGKTTITTLVTEILLNAGYSAIACGNIGVPVLDTLDKPYDFRVVELSSFQLECIPFLGADIAVCVNISADHLDRHNTLQEYAAIKKRIFSGCKQFIINRAEPGIAPKGKQPLYSFGLEAPQSVEQLGIIKKANTEYLAIGPFPLIKVEALFQQGSHHYQNILCASALALAVGVDIFSLLSTIKNFQGIAHRCELIGTFQGVRWVNDSKGTNIGAAEAAIEACASTLSGRLIWLVGGESKGVDFTVLQQHIISKVEKIFVFGKDAKKIMSALQKKCSVSLCHNLSEIVASAWDYAQSGDTVLFSPGCASFDMFKDYRARGDCFTQEVKSRVAIKELV